MRKTAIFIAAIFLMMATSATCLFFANNRDSSMPTQHEIRATFDKAVAWMQNNRNDVLKSDNYILWRMVMRSADLSKDPRLQQLYAEYKKRMIDPYPQLIWQHLFDQHSTVRVDFLAVTNLPDYNLFFIYGLTCDPEFANLAIVQEQLQSNFCFSNYPISSACYTHQLMGVQFMRDHNCGDGKDIDTLIPVLQDKIVTQLTWDPRAIDVYIQRVLMLTDTGARSRVKPIWLRRALEAQLDDGAWSGFQPLIQISSGRYIGFTRRGIGIGTPEGDFHATAQGLLLTSLMLDTPTQ